MRTIKRFISIFMTIVMIMTLQAGIAPQTAMAAEPVIIDVSTVSTNGPGYTCEKIIVNGKDEYVVTITDAGDYTLTGTINQFTDPTHPTQVIVSAPTANITLNNMNVTLINYSPLFIKKGSKVNLILASGTVNTLSLGNSEVSFSGLCVPYDASIVISGSGTLNAQGGAGGNGAGIGGGYNQFVHFPGSDKHGGNITINSGTVNAVGGPYGAGIGGASEGYAETVTINGGTVNATSLSSANDGAAGIGGGYREAGTVIINGGTVTAQSGHINAEAIGVGSSTTFAAPVTINGGTVKTLSSMRIKSTPTNNSGTNVYRTKVTLNNLGTPLSDTEVLVSTNTSTFKAKTDNLGNLYLWLPVGSTNIIASAGGFGYKATVAVTADDSSTFIANSYTPTAKIGENLYETWAEASAAVKAGETITLEKDTSILSNDSMPTVDCTIDGGSGAYKLILNSDQKLNSNLNFSNLKIAAADGIGNAKIICKDDLNNLYKLTTLQSVQFLDKIYIENGQELNIQGTLTLTNNSGISKFKKISIANSSQLIIFSLGQIESAEINGTLECKYFSLVSSTSNAGLLSGNGKIIFNNDGGESANLTLNNVAIDGNSHITLEAKDHVPYNDQFFIGIKGSDSPIANIEKLIMGNGYSGFKLIGEKYDDDEYDYNLKTNNIPKLKSGISATASAIVSVNSAYNLKLATIFEDIDNDKLSYNVSINGAASVSAISNYSYTPVSVGTTNLVFTANDGWANSTDFYSVTLNANSSNGNNNGNGNGNSSGSGSGGGSSSTPSTPTNPSQNSKGVVSSSLISGTKSNGTQAVSIPKDNMSALTDAAKKQEAAGAPVVANINTGSKPDLTRLAVTIPGNQFSSFSSETNASLRISSGLGSVTFSSDAIKTISKAGSGDINFQMSKTDNSLLNESQKKVIGDRPVYSFSVTVGETKISEFGSGVTATLPYSLKDGEDPNAIVVYFLDSFGGLNPMPCKYDKASGTVMFTTFHFSEYAIGYNKMKFKDVAEDVWYHDAVTYLAARGVTSGTEENIFSPNTMLTRGQFIVMLLRAYGISPDASCKDNFSDAGNKYYTDYLATAKKLNIANGIGNNKFSPNKTITRQEMVTLLYNALNKLDKMPNSDSKKSMSTFSDADDVASWAVGAMTALVESGIVSGNGDKLSSSAATTRAETAQVFYNLLSK